MLFSFNFYSNPIMCAALRLKIHCEFAENLLEIYVDTKHFLGDYGYLFPSSWIMDGRNIIKVGISFGPPPILLTRVT